MPASAASGPAFSAAPTKAAAAPPAAAAGESAPAGSLKLEDMDPTCAACDDFYRFANGGWLARNPVPEDRSYWSSYNEASDRTRAELKAILEQASRAAGAGGTATTEAKLGLLYSACMDEGRAASEGAEPVRDDLVRIAAIHDAAALQREITRLHLHGIVAPFSVAPAVDARDSARMVAEIWQAGTTFGDIGRYSATASGKHIGPLRDHIARMFELAGTPGAAARADADRVIAVETQLATASMTPLQMRDPYAVNNRLTLAQLQELMPHWQWKTYFEEVGAGHPDIVQVGQPDYLRALDRLLAERPPQDWQAYLRWHLINARAQWLSPELAQADFAFFASLSGAKAPRPRSSRCLAAVEGQMGDALGQIYARRVFTPQARSRGLAMIANLKQVMRERLSGLDWMSEATRKEALAKLDAMKAYVGGPARWIDYGPLKLAPGAFPDLLGAASRFRILERNGRTGKPVDAERWTILPQSISGSYSLSQNRILYPAAKFQPPFFDPLADDAVNYGALGATLGHEIVHGFDDQGRQYDAAGNLRDWWAPQDAARFKAKADRLVAQFGAYTVEGGQVDGRLALGENVADLGGLTLSYYALQKSLKGKPRRRIDGFTPEQRFFLSWARNWRSNSTPEELARSLRLGPHAPDRLRVLGPLSNMPEFTAAFGCKPGDGMHRPPAERVRIW